MLQKTKTGLHYVFSCFAFLLIALLINSCKKTDSILNTNGYTEITKEKTVENFFRLPANAPSIMQRIAKALEKQNMKTGFIKDFIAKEGFPIWNRSRIEKLRPTSLDSGIVDTIVYIPLVVDSQHVVHGFLKATVRDTVDIRIFRQNDYVEFPFQTPTSSTSVTTAENYAIRMMAMDKDVFGTTEFKLADRRLFNNSTTYSDTAGLELFIKLDSSGGGKDDSFASTGTSNVMYEVCYSVYKLKQIQCFGGSSNNTTTPCYGYYSTQVCNSYEEDPGGGGSGGPGWPYVPGGGQGGGSNPPCLPGDEEIVDGLVPIECTPGPGQNPWPSRDAHGFLYTRIAELKYQLSLNPAALEPCDSLNLMPLNPVSGLGSMWQDIAQHQLPGTLQDRIDSVNDLFTSSSYEPPLPMYQQTLDAASGGIVNCDFFPVKITQLPTGYTAQSLLEHFRKHMTDFAQPSCTFDPYTYTNGSFGISFNDSARFNAPYQNSVGALVKIGISWLNNGSVIESKYENYNSPPYNHESHQFIFSTLHTPLDFTHPVGGNRAFGIYNSTSNPTQYTFYAMGVDRVWHWLDVLLGFQNTVFQGGDELWTNMQSNMITFINNLPGGQATTFPTPKIIARPQWNNVEAYLKGTKTWEQLRTALGC